MSCEKISHQHIFNSLSADQTIEIGKKIAKKITNSDIIALNGTLGAGKTTFTKGFAAELGVLEEITSPTYTIISEYEGLIPLYHIDVYRLENEDDFIELGGEDFLFGDGVCLIEWSEKIKNLLPKKTITINFSIKKDNSRRITVENLSF
ncbi:MAG: tRNA (adenosine(37)-N6)-threonylcarbamoyltransferase complex ATPase subunit type 1 TsaE [Treponemataceae bacterium]